MAVAALSVSVLFAVILVAFGGIAFAYKKPLLIEPVLALPIIAIVLSFAARRVVRNSEGTRTGENLATAAWWLALILGLCYFAYLCAIDFAIRRDAEGAVEKWVGYLNKGDEDGLTRAFALTLPPGARQGIALERSALQLRYRDELASFGGTDLAGLGRRNKGGLSFAAGSVNWSYRGGSVECQLTGTVKCPEGSFPVTVFLKGEEGVSGAEGGGRQWTIMRPRGGGYVNQSRATRTPYGWMVALLEAAGGNYGRDYVAHTLSGPGSHYYAYRAYVKEAGPPRPLGESPRDRPPPGGWAEVAATPLLQLAFAAPAHLGGDEGYADYRASRFFTLPGGAAPGPARREEFFRSFDVHGLRPAGERLKDINGSPIDREDSLTETDAAAEVRVPVEITLPPVNGRPATARGRVVVECRDPAILAELKQLRASADPDQGTAAEPEGLRNKAASWRVVRVESDLAPVSTGPTPDQGGPPGGAPAP
jgi:hypothetical protein